MVAPAGHVRSSPPAGILDVLDEEECSRIAVANIERDVVILVFPLMLQLRFERGIVAVRLGADQKVTDVLRAAEGFVAIEQSVDFTPDGAADGRQPDNL